MVNVEKTAQTLLKKFAEKEDYEKRKIVFWYDKDETADEDSLAQIEEELAKHDIKIKVLADNFFEVKKFLEVEDTASNYLIYSPAEERGPEDNWLLDIQMYSGRFENSRISDIKSVLEIDGYDLDEFLEKRYKFFVSKKRTDSFLRWYQADWKEEEFLLGFLAVFSGSQSVDIREILRNLLKGSLQEEHNKIWADITKFELEGDFWDMIKRYFGYDSEAPILKKLFLSFIITHISRNTKLDLSSYEDYINKKGNECEIFTRNWMDHAKDSEIFDEYCQDVLTENSSKVENDLKSIIKSSDIADYVEAEATNLFDRAVISSIAIDLENGMENFDSYLGWIATRKTKHGYTKYRELYLALENAIMLHSFAKDLKDEELHGKKLKDLFHDYANKHYLMDQYYRKFYYYFDKNREEDILKNTREQVEKLYNNRFMDRLLSQWSEAINNETNGIWNVELVDHQNEFYKRHVDRVLSRNDKDKIAVIISDALRYEVAAELQEVLNKETPGIIELNTITGSLPSYTKLGMASLLPHKTLEYRDGRIFADGLSTEGLQNREKVLKAAFTDSVVLNEKDVISLKREEAREKFKGIRLFYIYHNKIDAIGDHSASEHNVFNATEEAVKEIKDVIGKLVNDQIVNNFIVTSDHGFIYKRDDLGNIDKRETSDFDKEQIVESNKRFILTTEDIQLKNTHKFNMSKTFDSDKELFLYTPQADLRFKLQGAGSNFVHGGVSPQEVVVPLLKYGYKKTAQLEKKGIKTGKVGLALTTPTRKITNTTFKVSFLQTEKVTDKMLPRHCRISLWDADGNRKISDEKVIIADSTSDDATERVYSVVLTLTSDVENKVYYLHAIDEDKNELNREIFDPISFNVDLLVTDDFF
ncbi:BREX-1 system phosphatase PglZ type A [Methanococcoides seepicolus]|uniref:BREX-1 system phosphatase PglZ type A n=1 Tax=Methanococcoides seepicolus TaxID=2828780 RepID=A0A9E4ZFQ9_9EURY|nr:BREX-1 system phosphatase PglZ type A [Methanococcoides seepicolus]MCM1987078.1 BREX-1 system phosphatase PglZ type A [Methanococcoides seepicolus]